MPIEELQAALNTAEAMASRLITLPGVTAIHMSPTPHHLEGPAIPLDPTYRLMVVVDDATATAYRERLITPLTISEMDASGAQITGSGEVIDAYVFPNEREETAIEMFFDLLNVNQDTAFPPSIWYDDRASSKWLEALEEQTVLDMLDEIGLVLVPADWYDNVEPYTSLKRTYTDDVGGSETFAVFSAEQWRFAAANYWVFDSNTGSFSSR